MASLPVVATRLREARKARGLSQEKLGVLAGIDEYSASARVNQYERGKHAPDFQMVQRFAAVLDYPVAYFFADADADALLLTMVHTLSDEQRVAVIRFIDELIFTGPK